MATTPQTAYEPHAGAPSRLQGGRVVTSGCTSPAWDPRLGPRSRCSFGRGVLRLRRARQALSRRAVGALRVNAGHGRAELGEAAARQAAELGFELERPPRRSNSPSGWRRSRRRRTGCSSPRGLRGGRIGLEAGPRLSQAHRGPAHQDHRARDRLPRHDVRGALDHRRHRPARPSSRSSRAPSTCRTRINTAGRRA